jgi:hypothetical protein
MLCTTYYPVTQTSTMISQWKYIASNCREKLLPVQSTLLQKRKWFSHMCSSIISTSWNVPATHRTQENIPTMPKAQNHRIFLICWWCPHNVTKKTNKQGTDCNRIQWSTAYHKIHNREGIPKSNTFPGPYNMPGGKKLNFTVYWKPTSEDYIIHYELCHPYRHKLWSMTYLINILHAYPVSRKSIRNKDHK